MAKREVFTTQPNRRENAWDVTNGGQVLSRHERQGDAWAETKQRAKAVENGQARLKGLNGQVKTEHTYPRSSDPRRHRG